MRKLGPGDYKNNYASLEIDGKAELKGVDVDNLSDRLKVAAYAEIMAVVKGIALSAFDFIVEETPQWSGAMAASTRIYAGRIDYSYTAMSGQEQSGRKRDATKHKQFGGKSDIPGKSMVTEFMPATQTERIQGVFNTIATKKKGDREAINVAYAANAGNLDAYRVDMVSGVMVAPQLHKEIYITNNVKHRDSSKSYAEYVEDNRNAAGSTFLRDVNLPSGMYARAAVHFSNLGTLSDFEQSKFKARAKKGI